MIIKPTKRFTFALAVILAETKGLILEKDKGGYSYWNPANPGTEGWAATLAEAVEDFDSM